MSRGYSFRGRVSLQTKLNAGLSEQEQEDLFQLEVLIEKGSAAVSCDANRTKTVCRTVEHMNSFY